MINWLIFFRIAYSILFQVSYVFKNIENQGVKIYNLVSFILQIHPTQSVSFVQFFSNPYSN